MDASLDTNVIIHLYKASQQSILFTRFDKLTVYSFIRTQELAKHAEPEILELFDGDVETGKIELITDQYLSSIGMYELFQKHVEDHRILYDNRDYGEVCAIALAITLGCSCLVTNDIKERGPHYTLMRTPDSEIIPFSFFEVLLLDYLEGRLTEEGFFTTCTAICDESNLKWDMHSKVKDLLGGFGLLHTAKWRKNG